jgi:hypothetical protein
VARCAAVVVAGLMALGLVAPAAGQPATDTGEATRSVMEQLEAFRRGDYDAAYGFASGSIRELFDRQAFERMVKGGYPEIARSAGAWVADSETGPDGHVLLRLKIRGANGNSIEAIYDMVREDGQWRINGVSTRPDAGLI